MPLEIVMQVFVNTQDKGEHFVKLTEDGDVRLTEAQWKSLGFTALPDGTALEEGDVFSLRSAAPRVAFEIDEKRVAVLITAEAGSLPKNRIDLSNHGADDVRQLKANAVFLNYDLQVSPGSGLALSNVSLPTELGLRLGDWSGQSGFSSCWNGQALTFARGLSSVSKDDPGRMRRITIGDFSAASGILGSGGIFGGVSLSKNFSMDPLFVTTPQFQFDSVLNSPSEVSLSVDGLLRRTDSLPEGEIEYANLVLPAGPADILFAIRDASGKVTEFRTSTYQGIHLLRPGLQDYSYNLGFRRRGLGQASFQYERPAFLGFHRVGLSRSVTVGLRSEVEQGLLNLGPTADFLVGRLGELSTSLAYSYKDGRSGLGAALAYTLNRRWISTGLAVQGYSRDFARLDDGRVGHLFQLGNEPPRFSAQLGLGLSRPGLGSLGARVSARQLQDGTGSTAASLSYGTRLLKNLSTTAVVTRSDFGEQVVNSASLTLSVLLNRDVSTSIEMQRNGDHSELVALAQKSPPGGTGLGYRFQANASADPLRGRQSDGQAQFSYGTRHGILSLDYRNFDGVDSYKLGLAGGIALVDHSFFLSRPIAGSFAVIDVEGVPGVGVYVQGQKIGTTGRRGKVFVPQLGPYQESQISIDTDGSPIDYEFSELEQTIATSRGGAVARFRANRRQALSGHIYFVEDGARTAAEFASLDVDLGGQPLQTMAGKGGEFYLENLPPGSYTARVATEAKSCELNLVIPKSEALILDLGELSCTPQRGQ